MNLSNEINDVIQNAKSLSLNLKDDVRIDNLKQDLTNVTDNVIQKASRYIIKAMPVPDAVKDILLDVSDVLKTRNFNTIISTAIKSSIREGFEILGISTSSIKNLADLKNVATKGGFITCVKNGIEIVANNYLKNNIVANYVYKFFDNLRSFVQSKDFMDKINKMIKKLDDKKTEFLNKCEEWFCAYKNMDIKSINNISDALSNNNYVLNRYKECVKENSIIQNMTAMVNNSKKPLSECQQRLCEVIS